MGAIASHITSLSIVYPAVYSDADQRKHQSSASLAFVWGIRRGPVNSPHKWPVTPKMFPFDDVIMTQRMEQFQRVHVEFTTVSLLLCGLNIDPYTPMCMFCLSTWCTGCKKLPRWPQHGLVIIFITKCGTKLIIHHQTSKPGPMRMW